MSPSKSIQNELKVRRQVQTALQWIEDARKMMNEKGCGWPDASDSLRMAEKALKELI